MDKPDLRAEIRRQLAAGICGWDIKQKDLCDLFGVSQYTAKSAVAEETELYLREQIAQLLVLPHCPTCTCA